VREKTIMASLDDPSCSPAVSRRNPSLNALDGVFAMLALVAPPLPIARGHREAVGGVHDQAVQIYGISWQPGSESPILGHSGVDHEIA